MSDRRSLQVSELKYLELEQLDLELVDLTNQLSRLKESIGLNLLERTTRLHDLSRRIREASRRLRQGDATAAPPRWSDGRGHRGGVGPPARLPARIVVGAL